MTQGPTIVPLPSEAREPTRLCGRCRQSFDGDPTMPVGPLTEWWLCTECRSVLMPKRVASAEAAARALDPQ